MLFAKTMLSRTDFTSVWNRPNQSTSSSDSGRISELWTTPNKKALHSPVKQSDLAPLTSLVSSEQFGLQWLLQKEPEDSFEETPFTRLSIDWIMESAEFKNEQNKVHFVLEALRLSEEEICTIEANTRGQRSNTVWLQIRKKRLTASNFGLILGQICRRLKNPNYSFTKSLFKTLNQEYCMGGVRAIGYGVQHEADAAQQYSRISNHQVIDAGLFLHRNGILGASPDGVISSDRLVEFKCPFTFRNSLSLDEVIFHKQCCLIKAGRGYDLKRNHNYYHQVQGQLYICNKQFCDFVYWTPKWCEVVTVQKDPEWEINLELLEEFYKNIYLDHIIGK